MSKLNKHGWIIVTGVLTIVIVGWNILRTQHVRPAMPAVMVQATTAKITAMPIEISAPGVVESQQSITITPQVTGSITKIAFQSGERVKAGQLLFEINPEIYAANLQQARAVLQRDEALLVSQKADALRYAELVKLEYVTKQQYDQAKSAADAQAAVVVGDKAQVKQAEIQLGYTQIYAPASGKTGEVIPRIGDVVTANSTTPLVTINQLEPLWVKFNIPQNKLLLLQRYKHQAQENQKEKLPVKVYTEDGKALLGDGLLNFVDNTINPQTGTVLLKAEMQNENQLLWPGLMVTVKLILTMQPDSIVVPMQAIQVDQEGNFIYIVEDKTAVLRRVEIDRQIGDLGVISKGLKGNETVLTVIPPHLENGTPVDVTETTE